MFLNMSQLRKDRPVAQLAEWRSPKPQVGGSIPSWPANIGKMMIMVQSKNKLDMLLWTGVIVLTLIVLFSHYVFKFEGAVEALLWIGWLVLALVMSFFTEKGKELFAFAIEAKDELLKVVWPSKQETIQTTSIVMLMVVVTGFLLWGADIGMMWIIGKLTHLG